MRFHRERPRDQPPVAPPPAEATAAANDIVLNEAARRGLAIRLDAIAKQLDAIASLGIDEPGIAALRRDACALMEELSLAVAPPPPPDPVGMMMRVLILLDEIAPDSLRAYGPLDPGAAALLEDRVGELYESAETLQRELRRRGPGQDGSATPRQLARSPGRVRGIPPCRR